MDRRTFMKTVPALAMLARPVPTDAAAASAPTDAAKDLQRITLPRHETDGGKSVLAALQERRTHRNISDRRLPLQTLSNLLWAAFGVNRERGSFGKPGRTAASASNSQEIDLYVALPEGVYLYEAVPHCLTPVVAGDFRARSGRGAAVRAPVNIFYIVDLTRYVLEGNPDRRINDPEVQKSYYYCASGLIAQNVGYPA
ncbi:MAG: nitroreductase family protein [Sedimentisphaerales bacterium]|nr:nitroreductase family protein [Sedimentisphaerales bacterium]